MFLAERIKKVHFTRVIKKEDHSFCICVPLLIKELISILRNGVNVTPSHITFQPDVGILGKIFHEFINIFSLSTFNPSSKG